MRNIRHWAALATGALLALASCSTPKTIASSPSAAPSASSTAAASPGASTSVSKKAPTATPTATGDEHGSDVHDDQETLANRYSKTNPPSEDFRVADTGDSSTGAGRVPLQMRTRPSCAEGGGTIEVTLRTKPNIKVAILSTVPREQDGKLETYDGRSGRDGTWSYLIRIPLRLTPGQYDVMAAAADDRGQDGGRSGNWFVIVAERGGCGKR